MHILLFLKAPRPGTVKTRLAGTLGDQQALEIYKKLVKRQLENLPGTAQVEIHFSPGDAEAEMRNWLGDSRTYYPQCEGNLGDRLTCGVCKAFDRGAETIACIGGDCPGLLEHFFIETEAALNHGQDLVLGPTFDGGYYLIAMKSCQPELFENIPWSHPDTLNVTLIRAEARGLKTALLECLSDVDRETDWVEAQRLYDL